MSTMQWYPGHMAKAVRKIKQDLSKADFALVLCDARAPVSSNHEDFHKIFASKPFALVLNKCDIADEAFFQQIRSYYASVPALFFVDCMKKSGIAALRTFLASLKEQNRIHREARVMVAGMPNVGKSMLINALAQKAIAKTGNRAGVTVNQQWIKTQYGFWMLDTPGVLPPKFENQTRAMKLASIGCIKEEVLDQEELAVLLCAHLLLQYPSHLEARYGISVHGCSAVEVLESVARKRGFLQKGSQIDFARTCRMFLDEFKSAKLGRICLDWDVLA